MKIKILILGVFCSQLSFAQNAPKFRNEKYSIEERLEDLIAQLTLPEKASLMGYRSAAVPRLGIPAYNWWNEGLHGVARAGEATVFPQAIALAATFDPHLIQQVGDVIATEARAKYQLTKLKNQHLQYMGLTFWSPNINIFRDPRWGRGQETYGEDPFLTGSIATAYIKGMQGNDPNALKTSTTAKHFAAHSGPEAKRDYFDAKVDEKDLRETYLYAFHKAVQGGVESIMTAYNRVNGFPTSTHPFLLQQILRDEWKFQGHVVTDCGALDDIYLTHKVLPDRTSVAAAAIKAGVNLDCSSIFQTDIEKAIQNHLITENEVNSSLKKSLKTLFKLGFFDSESKYQSYGVDSIHNVYHQKLAYETAVKSMILLHNDKKILPLHLDSISSVMVIGPNAASLDALVANYHGLSSKMVNFVEGITQKVGPSVRVEYDLGVGNKDTTHFGGIWAAGNADVTIAVLGLSPVLEGEAGDAFLSTSGGDKQDLDFPKEQIAFLKELRKKVQKPIVAVVNSGSALDISAILPYSDAVILAWYPGEQGGTALADILFGSVSPSGHLPVTFYNSLNDLPDYENYAMKGRTYRYFDGKVQYPFGFGLSYTHFDLKWNAKPKPKYTSKDTLNFKVQIQNTGAMDGEEVLQAYLQYPNFERMPLKELKAFKRVKLLQNQSEITDFQIPISELQKWDLKSKSWKVYPGTYTIFVGNHAEDKRIQTQFNVQH